MAKKHTPKKSLTASKYYVYQLVDPITNEPFYIGKGCGRRAWAHLNGQADASNRHKQRRIDAIRAEGHEPRVDMLREYLAEIEALQAERELIAQHQASLTNVSPGQQSVSPRGLKRARCALSACLRLKDRSQIATKDWDDFDRFRNTLLKITVGAVLRACRSHS